jgi:hypothetical protein
VGFVLPEGDSRYYNRAMPATDEENVAPQSPKSQKDGWDRSDIISKWVSAIAAVAVPIVILVGSCQIQKSVAEQSVQVQKSIAQQSLAKDYVGFAISILERPEQEGNSDLREWATKLLVHHAPEGDEFNPKAQEQLKRLERAQHGPPQGHFENSFSPDGKKQRRSYYRFAPVLEGSTILSPYMIFRKKDGSRVLTPVLAMILRSLFGRKIAPNC